MPTKKFTKQELIEVCRDDSDYLEDVVTTLDDSSRWALQYTQVFRDTRDGKFYMTYYQTGATEQQDESPYEYEDDELDVREVEPYEVTVTKYRAVK